MIDLEKARLEYMQRRKVLVLTRERVARQLEDFVEYMRTRRRGQKNHSGEATI